jgi:hypothetical protein
METILREYLWIFMYVFIDDVPIVSKTKEEHLVHCEKVFKKISRCGIDIANGKMSNNGIRD